MDGCFTFQRGKSGDSLAPGPLLSHTLGLTSNHRSRGNLSGNICHQEVCLWKSKQQQLGQSRSGDSTFHQNFFTGYGSGSNLVTAKIQYLLLFTEFQNGKSDDSLAPGPLLSHTLGLTSNHSLLYLPCACHHKLLLITNHS